MSERERALQDFFNRPPTGQKIKGDAEHVIKEFGRIAFRAGWDARDARDAQPRRKGWLYRLIAAVGGGA